MNRTWWRCCLVVIFAVASALCVCGPALFFAFNKGFKVKKLPEASCPLCVCRCSPPQSLIKIAPGLANLSVTDCGKDDPELKAEMEKHIVDLLSEELKLQKAVGEEQSRHMNMTLKEARNSASQYKREAEKCNAATESCEGARERAEILLIREKKTTLLWQRRAKLLGWEARCRADCCREFRHTQVHGEVVSDSFVPGRVYAGKWY
ncbi:uncharacterized protein LOC127263650 [Andrographis paniculata]|uniref:uncharacterized protein LOC127263650 n=1 Tax=Andrographis paniculata TaxID=175694 RepID=UPI0021E96C83|nr:uncharacterized protein LOC127263650 [Andrographis paniculata]